MIQLIYMSSDIGIIQMKSSNFLFEDLRAWMDGCCKYSTWFEILVLPNLGLFQNQDRAAVSFE